MAEEIRGFIKEEQAQGSIEYILVAGAAIVTAIMIASSYRKTAYSRLYTSQYESVNSTLNTLCTYIERYLEAQFDVCM